MLAAIDVTRDILIGGTVTVRVTGDTLVLSADGFSATYRNHGPATDR